MKSYRACLLALAAAACSTPPQPAPPPAPTPAKPSATNTATAPTPPPAAANAPTTMRLPNGIAAAWVNTPPDIEAQLQLGFLAGTDFGNPGIAELALEAVVANNDASQGRPDLRQAIARLRGTVRVEVGPLTSWITVRVPFQRWRDAHRAIAAALQSPTQSRNQLERIRDDYVVRRTTAIWTDPDREASRAFQLGATSTAEYIASLMDRDVSEISLFQSRLFRPDSILFSVHAPGEVTAVTTELTTGIGAWQVPPVARQVVPTTTRTLHPGLYWAPAPGQPLCRASLVLPLPSQLRLDAADLLLVHGCLTLDGIGGRLEQLQRERGLGHVRWRTQVLQYAETAALVLTAEVTPAEAVALWNCAERARQSLVDLPPSAAEVAIAVRRAPLTAVLGEADTAVQQRNQAVRMLRQLPADAVTRRIADLQRWGFDAKAAAQNYLAMPAAMIVFGGDIPRDAAGVRSFELLPAGAAARLAGASPAVQASAAVPWLEPAMQSVGGKELLLRLAGFDAEAKLQADRSPTATETVAWRTAGTLQRRRTVLGTAVVTTIAAGKGSDEAGPQRVGLSGREVDLLRREMERHPLLLLAAHARGELPFRPVAQRNVGDRDFMVLEAVSDRFDRLRIHVDTGSHLIRVVEAWETTSDGAVVHIQDHWSDYRDAAGLRVPFRRLTEQDDGQNRIEAVYTDWVPSLVQRRG